MLNQKEHYSDYVFEDIAFDYLKKHPELQKQLDDEKAKNPQLAQSGAAQLEYIYRNSPFYENTYMRYPVGRLLTDTKLDLQ